MPMGSELNNYTKPGLVYNRYISGYVIGTGKIKTIQIIRNGKIYETIHPNKDKVDFEFDDMESLDKIVLSSPDSRPPFTFYYLRVIQEDGHMAWSSPIWIDYLDEKAIAKLQLEKAAKKKSKSKA